MRWLWFSLWFLASPISAQSDPAQQAREALIQLDAAAQKLQDADKARDRVRALTETVQAYEAGLTAIRDSLRSASLRESQLRNSLQARDKEIAQLMGILLAIQPGTNPRTFLHPNGPTGTARAGMLLADLTPELNRQAVDLRLDLENVANLALLQRNARAQLQRGLSAVTQSRVALNTAMAERTDLPMRFFEDDERAATLLASSETLDAFSSGLASVANDDIGWTPPPLQDQIGMLPLPVRGVTLRRANEADAAGITRPGLLMATRSGALVASPTAATIRYIGPLLDFGTVVILEPRADTLFIFAGLDRAYGEAGQVITDGTPVGLMGGLKPDLSLNPPSIGGERGSTERRETLYIEVRQNNTPQDPAEWFRIDEDK
ncbi:MAG: peptidase M23 [Paracoccaceae bacterium]